jgi:NAD(P)-dependent dehydrogenase (short-subunit alcohol dehydrogenase family)
MTNKTHLGRTVLISGASSGVGAHVSRLLAAAGAKVVLGARRADRLASLVASIEEAGGRALAVSLDVADEASVSEAYHSGSDRFGPIDTVVASAGVAVVAPAISFRTEDFDEIMRVNLRGAFLLAREGARRMVDADVSQGRIVFVASIGGHAVLPGLAAYSASKAGLIMLGRSLAADWARHGITVNTICPGYMETEMNQDWFTTQGGRRQIDGFRRKRLMPLQALDPGMLYLTSDAGAYTTGATLTVDDAQSI